MNIGIVGHGFVGRAIRAWFERTHAVFVYDKAEHPESALAALAAAADLIFVAVPTPMAPDGSCHTGIVDGALVMLARALNRVGRRPVVVLKSTVTPGYTALARETTGLRLVFSPEFLTERSSEQDFATINRVIVGGPIDDATVVFEAFERSGHPCKVFANCEPNEAELAKLFTNAWFMTKVLLANELAVICERLGLPYARVAELAALDPRMGATHLQVPGHDGYRGAGGHCLPKDTENLRHLARALGTGEKILTAVIERNRELRERMDWLEMKGRAVTDQQPDEARARESA